MPVSLVYASLTCHQVSLIIRHRQSPVANCFATQMDPMTVYKVCITLGKDGGLREFVWFFGVGGFTEHSVKSEDNLEESAFSLHRVDPGGQTLASGSATGTFAR